MNKVEQANRYIDLIRVKSNEALLFLSLGKDSLVLLDFIRGNTKSKSSVNIK